MRVLAINAGSATLKFGVFESARTLPLIDSAIDHPAVDAATFEEIERHLHRAGVTTLDGIGHRIAHGGPLLSNAVLVDEEVEREIGAEANRRAVERGEVQLAVDDRHHRGPVGAQRTSPH